MSTTALQTVWNGLLAYNLTTSNKRWLAEHLWQQVEDEEATAVQPYTMAEIDAILAESEADFAAGRYKTNDQVFHRA